MLVKYSTHNNIPRLLPPLYFLFWENVLPCCVGWPWVCVLYSPVIPQTCDSPAEALWTTGITYMLPHSGICVSLTNNYGLPWPCHFDKSCLSHSSLCSHTVSLLWLHVSCVTMKSFFRASVLSFWWLRQFQLPSSGHELEVQLPCYLDSSPKTGNIHMMNWYGTPTLLILLDSFLLQSVDFMERKPKYQFLSTTAGY